MFPEDWTTGSGLCYCIGTMNASIYFQGGTLVLAGVEEEKVPSQLQYIKGRWRCEAYHYSQLLPWLKEQGIHNNVARWQKLKVELADLPVPHDYQLAALASWQQAQRRGSIVLPTGAGKTFVAIQAIHQTQVATVVLVPTLDLLYQWYVRFSNAFASEIGVYYGGEKLVRPITVTTYHSAGDLIAAHGNAFKLLICDEVHHLPARTWGEAALMSPAPYRLGLTATYPEEYEQMGGRWRVEDLLGPIVYQQRLESLVGKQLAEYRTQRMRVDLTDEERIAYDKAYQIYTGFIREHRLRTSHGPGWLQELTRLSSFDVEARKALLARQEAQRIVSGCEAKFRVLETLLREHSGERILIFTESNAVAYKIAQEYLIPIISFETGVPERKKILDEFKAGRYRAVVTSKVLNEGVDVPEAKIAIVMGGGSSKREYVQRLGRILRKKENMEALLFELLARSTLEEGKVQRRHVKREDR